MKRNKENTKFSYKKQKKTNLTYISHGRVSGLAERSFH